LLSLCSNERGGYVEPFALRALGVVRGDGALVARAAERFIYVGLSRRVSGQVGPPAR
jgi:hypothetical protein